MNIFSTSLTESVDCRLCLASIAAVYSPLVLILGAALVLF